MIVLLCATLGMLVGFVPAFAVMPLFMLSGAPAPAWGLTSLLIVLGCGVLGALWSSHILNLLGIGDTL